jgi:hypothetical protein
MISIPQQFSFPDPYPSSLHLGLVIFLILCLDTFGIFPIILAHISSHL